MDNYIRDYARGEGHGIDLNSVFSVLMRKVYLWMTLALVVSGLTAYYIATDFTIMSAIFSSRATFWVLVIAELGLVLGLSAAIDKISFPVAAVMFLVYSVLNGVMLSAIFIVYTMTSIATTFLVTAGTFGAMALIGSVTKRDLTRMGGILLMALIGLIIATVVNLFLHNTMMDLIISGVGVLLFTGLTAYDAQKIKNIMLESDEVSDTTQKIAVLGALTLYLDFINLFLYLLRFLGRSKN